MDWITRLQVIFDALDDELDQIAIGVYEYRDEKISLEEIRFVKN